MAEFPEDLSDINRALVDGDYILVNKLKSALSRVWTYVQAKGAAISEGGVAVADADTVRFIDATDSTEKRFTLDRLKTFLFSGGDIAEALADTDLVPVQNASGSFATRTFALSRISTYIQAAIPIAVGSWTPTYTNESNLTSTTHSKSIYIRVGSAWVAVTCFGTTRNSATVAKSFRMTLPSFISNNWSDGLGVLGAGQGASDSVITATNVRLTSVSGATTAEVRIYDTASSGSISFVIVMVGQVP